MSQGIAGTSPAPVGGLVSDSRPTGFLDGETQPLSLTPDGRLRVAASESVTYMEFFRIPGSLLSFDPPDLTNAMDLWDHGSANPRP